ncbi:MAG: Gfo/Idh/MocA family oxidoreductase [Ruminococcaceae bacterium]|nr:Gfo/Idh/MocA family oxidoreductase [Oscillospiraceae bacterium]
MEKIRAILIGAGIRGKTYTDYAKDFHDDRFELVAVAEPDEGRREAVRKKHGIAPEQCVSDWTELLNRPRFADVAIIATQDRQHFAPAMKAIELGYNLLLEKPMAVTPEDCMRIADYADEKGVTVMVCHVLRFTPFFKRLKEVIDAGMVGEIVNVIHVEAVGHRHYAHSYTRGNWNNLEKSSPMILAKSSHDMDILQWLVGKRCTRVQSFGALRHFKKENCPEGAPYRCIEGCPHAERCPYDAVRTYLVEKERAKHATGVFEPCEEDIVKALKESPYGVCVYQSDNDVVDHQTVNLEFEGGALVSFTMSAFNKGGRFIRIMGTKGEATAYMNDDKIRVFDFLTGKTVEVPILNAELDETIFGGHGGGDKGIVEAFVALMDGTYEGNSLSDGITCAENHLMAFAAEESRVTGKVIDMKDYIASFRK